MDLAHDYQRRCFDRRVWLVRLLTGFVVAMAVHSVARAELNATQLKALHDMSQAAHEAGARSGSGVSQMQQQMNGRAVGGVVILTAGPGCPDGVEACIFQFAQKVEATCAATLTVLSTDLRRSKDSATTWTAWGALIAVLGSVAVNPAHKTVLVGIGITPGGDNKSVMSQSLSGLQAQAAADQAAIDAIRAQFTANFNVYKGITPAQDPLGSSRNGALLSTLAACDGLMAAAGATPGNAGH